MKKFDMRYYKSSMCINRNQKNNKTKIMQIPNSKFINFVIKKNISIYIYIYIYIYITCIL